MKQKKSSLVKKIKISLEYDDFGFGSRRVIIENNFMKEIKISLCPVEGVIYHF